MSGGRRRNPDGRMSSALTKTMIPAGWMKSRVSLWCCDVGKFYLWRNWMAENIDSVEKMQCGWMAGGPDEPPLVREMLFSDEKKWAMPRGYYESGPGIITMYFASEGDAAMFKLACG